MTAILYPVAATADGALHAPHGLAAREQEAREVACGAVSFVTEPVGPAFPSEEAALQAYGPRDQGGLGAPARRGDWSRLSPMTGAEGDRPRSPARPVYRAGRRWPDVGAPQSSLWRLWVSYWRIEGEAAAAAPTDAARRLRRAQGGRTLEGAALNALARQPLRPVELQQPLDFGLFEIALPENPGHVIPDE